MQVLCLKCQKETIHPCYEEILRNGLYKKVHPLLFEMSFKGIIAAF